MNQLNSLIIEGNVARQAELLEPTAGFKVCKFPVAVDRWYKNRNGEGVTEVSFFDVETYGKMAEICEKQSLKGRGIRVVGRLKQDRWKDAEGKYQSKIFVVAEHVEFKPKPQTNSETAESKENSGSNLVMEATTAATVSSEQIKEAVVF